MIHGLVTDPTARQVFFNPKHDELSAPVVGKQDPTDCLLKLLLCSGLIKPAECPIQRVDCSMPFSGGGGGGMECTLLFGTE